MNRIRARGRLTADEGRRPGQFNQDEQPAAGGVAARAMGKPPMFTGRETKDD